jgi:hypothetical protein
MVIAELTIEQVRLLSKIAPKHRAKEMLERSEDKNMKNRRGNAAPLKRP